MVLLALLTSHFFRRLFAICYCSGVLRGQPDEVPSTMQFKPSFEDGALLTVAWSSGRVQHVSFTFMAQNFES